MATKLQTVRAKIRLGGFLLFYFIYLFFMKKDTLRQQVYSLLKKYGHLTTEQLTDRVGLVFGIIANEHSVRKYRDEYEKQFVGMVVEVGTYKPFCNKSKRKVYAQNGCPFQKKPYKTPFTHFLRLLWKSGTVAYYKRHFEKA